jgi:hypothetical protein
MNKTRAVLGILGAALVLAACGSGRRASTGATAATAAAGQASPSTTTTEAYHPAVDPARFTNQVTNRYFPLKPGTTTIYEGTRDGQPQHTEMTVTAETRTIMGVRCVVVRDTVTSNGALVEKTTDWYAQAASGAVWYFGESTAEYTNGAVSSTKGSWEAGVDGAQPGIIMQATPRAGDHYRQEYRPGEAEDVATVLRVDPSIQVPGGTFRSIVVTEDRNPLEPDKLDQKQFAPGVGLVYTKRVTSGHQEESSYVKTTAG